jgi:hypothetical protein
MKSIGYERTGRIVNYLILKALPKIKQCFYLNKSDNKVIHKKSDGKSNCLFFVKPGKHSYNDGKEEKFPKIYQHQRIGKPAKFIVVLLD